MRRMILLAVLVALFSLGYNTPVSAQNVFSRKIIEPAPEPEPQITNNSQTPLPPTQVSTPVQPTILDYEIELSVLQLVGIRDGVAVVRAPENIYFLKDGEKFVYNGAVYNVGIKSDAFKLSIGEYIKAEEEGEDDIEPIEVFERRIGRTLNISIL